MCVVSWDLWKRDSSVCAELLGASVFDNSIVAACSADAVNLVNGASGSWGVVGSVGSNGKIRGSKRGCCCCCCCWLLYCAKKLGLRFRFNFSLGSSSNREVGNLLLDENAEVEVAVCMAEWVVSASRGLFAPETEWAGLRGDVE